MDLNRLIPAVLSVIEEILVGLRGGISWRKVKRLIRKYIWRPYLKPAIVNQKFGWVDDALMFLMLVKLLWRQFDAAPESLKKSGIDHKAMLSQLAGK